MLFKETTVSGITVKNRIIRSATHDGLADENGAPSDKLIAKYENLAKNEIAVHRRILGIRPCFVEVFNEDTKNSGYYRSYQKALQMKQVQCTKMWDPHICMGADQRGALPLIKQN